MGDMGCFYMGMRIHTSPHAIKPRKEVQLVRHPPRRHPMTTPTDAALSQLRHLYQNMTNGGVRDTASAKRIAEGLLSPAIAQLEKAVTGGEPVVEQFEAMHARGDVWITTLAAAKLARSAPPPQAVREPTPIRCAALELYTPPFRHEHGYIRDANHQMVADDASSEATGLIAARIRGWGRIQYMDKPEMRANALQDEVAEVVAEALNAYWAAHGITKGG
jgi:hypothetical protein